MKLTFEEAIENHKKMWNWIADETLNRKKTVTKSDYFKENNIEECYNYCFCCQYATDNSDITQLGLEMKNCMICPIDWCKIVGNYDECQCFEHNTPYDWWIDACDLKEWKIAAKYARQIANLPLRQEHTKC